MKFILISAVILIINVSCFGVAADKSETNKMIYIKVNLINGKPAAINYEILDGKIKSPKVKEFIPNGIYYELLSNEETVINDGLVSDPSNQKYEYVDGDGKLKSVEVKNDSTEIIIRANYNNKISKINLYKIPADKSLRKSREKYLSIGSFSININ